MDKNVKYRNELKFVLNKVDAELIKSTIASACFLDEHVNSDGSYEVKSIYFDTLSDKCLFETLDGVNKRHKFRVRKYGNSNEIFKFEKKMSENGLKRKRVDLISRKMLFEILNGSFGCENISDKQVLAEFFTEHLLYMHRPVVVIGYKRIPFIYPIGNVRVTFDSNIVASDDINVFFNDYTGLEKEVIKDMVILEVKYDGVLPPFIRKVLNNSGILEQSAFSKYVMARNALNEGNI